MYRYIDRQVDKYDAYVELSQTEAVSQSVSGTVIRSFLRLNRHTMYMLTYVGRQYGFSSLYRQLSITLFRWMNAVEVVAVILILNGC